MKGTILPQPNGQVKPLSDYVTRKLLQMVELSEWSAWWDAPPEDLGETIADLQKSGLTPQTCQKARLIPLSYFLRQIEETTARRFIKVITRLSSSTLDGRDLLKDGELLGFPYFSKDGELLFVRIRSYPPLVFKDHDGDEREVKYLQPKGTPALPYILPEVWSVAQKPHKPIWLTEGEKKALSLIQNGRYAIALSGVWNFRAGEETARTKEDKDFWQELQDFNWSGRVVYLGFDMDMWTNPQVRMALFELGIKLMSLGAVVRVPFWDKSLKGIDDFLAEKLEELDVIEEKAKNLADVVRFEDLNYIARALARAELSYSKREQLINLFAKPLRVRPKVLGREVFTIKQELQAEKRESVQQKVQKQKEKLKNGFSPDKEDLKELSELIPEEFLKPAMEILKGNIVQKFLDDTELLYAGRQREKLLVYLVAMCRKVLSLESNPCLVIKGDPAIGKSQLVRNVLSLCGEDAYVEASYQTPKFLYHISNGLKHKVLFLTEWSSGRNAVESLKLSITERGLRWAGVEKDELGRHSAVYKKVDTLPMPIITTGVDPALPPDFSTRTITLTLVSDRELYRRALEVKRTIPVEEKVKVLRIWQTVDFLLENAEVVIPWIRKYVDAVKNRIEEGKDLRDEEKFFALIQASAVLHQYQRRRDEKGRIIATEEDYRIAYSLSELFSEMRGGLPRDVLAVVEVVRDLTSEVEDEEGELQVVYPTRKQVIEEVMRRTGKSEPTVKRWIQKARNMAFISIFGQGREKSIRLTVEEIPQPTPLFPPPEEIFRGEPDDPNDPNHAKALKDSNQIGIMWEMIPMIQMNQMIQNMGNEAGTCNVDYKDYLDHSDHVDHSDHKDHGDNLDHPDYKDHMDHQDHLDVDHEDHTDHLDHPDHLDKDHMDHVDHQRIIADDPNQNIDIQGSNAIRITEITNGVKEKFNRSSTEDEDHPDHVDQKDQNSGDPNQTVDIQDPDTIRITEITRITDKKSLPIWTNKTRIHTHVENPNRNDIRTLEESLNKLLVQPYRVDCDLHERSQTFFIYVLKGSKVISRLEFSLKDGLDYGQCFDAVERVIRQELEGVETNQARKKAHSEADFLTALEQEFKRLKKQYGFIADRMTYYYNSHRKVWELIKGNETVLKIQVANGVSVEECLTLLRKSFEEALTPPNDLLDF